MSQSKHLYKTATGKLSATLRNDLLFHYIVQKSNIILKNLISSLKELNPEEIKEVVITNPIDYASYTGKEVILDVKVILNNEEILDIELQMYHDKWWKERSLLYMCRSFDSLESGEDYYMLMPTTFIGIVDEDQFPEHKEFYSSFLFLHEQKHYPYSSKLKLNVLYLNQIDLATEQDKINKIDYWAKLFKSDTWEDLKILAEQSPIGEEVAEVMYEALIQSEEKTLFEAHQKYLYSLHATERHLKESYDEGFKAGFSHNKEEITAMQKAINEKDEEIARLKALLRKQ